MSTKNLYPLKRKYFRQSRNLLLTKKEKLNEERLLALEVMPLRSQDLSISYYLKELFYDFIKQENRQEAVKRLKKFMLYPQASQL